MGTMNKNELQSNHELRGGHGKDGPPLKATLAPYNEHDNERKIN